MQQANSQSHLHVMLIDTAMIPVSSMLTCDRWRSRTFRGCLWLELPDYDHIRFTTALQVRTISRTCTSWYATVATMNAFLCTSKQHKRRQVRHLFAPNWDEGWPNHECHLRPERYNCRSLSMAVKRRVMRMLVWPVVSGRGWVLDTEKGRPEKNFWIRDDGVQKDTES